jgi:hypothetical protein
MPEDEDEPEVVAVCTRCGRKPTEQSDGKLHKGYCIVCYDYLKEYAKDDD